MQKEQFHLHSRMEENHWWFTGRREIVRRLVQEFLPTGQTLLDVGCGTGGNLAAFGNEYRCVGWDPTEEAIRLAQQRFPNSQFLSGPLMEAAAVLGQSPDGILAMDVLEHVETDQTFFAQLVKLLRPGGHLLLTVPAGMELWSPHDVSFGHFRRYSRPQLEELWVGQPIIPSLVSHYNSRLYPVVRSVRTWNRLTGQASGEANTDFRLPPPAINQLLKQIFSSEAGRLVQLLKKQRRQGFSQGVSLIAILRKKDNHGSN